MSEDKVKGFVKELDAFKDRLAAMFQELGLGKDQLLRAMEGVDFASRTLASHEHLHQGEDLNDRLVDDPKDHPAVRGQGEKPPITLDDPAADPEVASQDPERRTGSKDTKEPKLATGDPVRSKDAAETSGKKS